MALHVYMALLKPPTLTDSLAFGNCIRWFWQKGKFRVIQIRVRAKMSGMPRNKGLGIGAIIHRLLFFPCRQIWTVNLDRKDIGMYINGRVTDEFKCACK